MSLCIIRNSVFSTLGFFFLENFFLGILKKFLFSEFFFKPLNKIFESKFFTRLISHPESIIPWNVHKKFKNKNYRYFSKNKMKTVDWLIQEDNSLNSISIYTSQWISLNTTVDKRSKGVFKWQSSMEFI